MCGIAGIIDNKKSHDENYSMLKQMLLIQHHRGPDATGIWSDESIYLGHNRLSIIDLSEAGNQPMHYMNFTIIFNGEIYNYIEVKKRLIGLKHIFETESDTEVILHAFAEWGKECVNHFVGMWAFVIWDRIKKELFASRDRFGMKPFNYMSDGKRLYFASEIKTLKFSPIFSSEINVNQVARGLQLGWLGYYDETYYSKIRTLPAAHNLTFNEKGIEVYPYWNISTGVYSDLSFEEKKHKFYELFADSIKIHLRSDVSVASCLSGGIDSSSIVSMVQHLNPGFRTKSFSVYYEGDGDVDERPFINEVINKYPTIDPYYLSPKDSDIQENFHKALYHADVPASGSSFISHFMLIKLIAENNIKVVLNGQGADEYLGGYMHSFYRLIAGFLVQNQFSNALRTTKEINNRMGNNLFKTISHFGKSVLATRYSEQQLYAFEYRNYYPFMTNTQSMVPPFELSNVTGSRLDQFLVNLLQHTSLPSILHYEDRNSMAFSVESRVPFLDHRLVEFAFTLSDVDKIKCAETKYILRETLKSILPYSIYSRKDKKGFVTPGENKWLRGPLKFLIDSSIKFPDFINKEKADRILSEYKSGDNSKAKLVWRLAMLGEWLKK